MKKVLSLLLAVLLLFSSSSMNVIADNIECTTASTEAIDNTTVIDENIVDSEQTSFELNDSITIDDVKITVTGTFAEEGTLSIKKVESQALSENNIAESYSYDIKVLNNNGEELQPLDKVNVSFEFVEISQNLEVEVFHEKEPLDVLVEDNTATVESDGFSIYTVEFTYEDKQYILEGDTYVKLSDILLEIGLTGEVSSYEVSNSDLFDIFRGNGDCLEYVETYNEEGNLVEYYPKNEGSVLYMVALQPFTSEEWLKVTIDDIEYTIVVTDAIRMDEDGNQVGTNVRFMQESSAIGTITDNRVIQGPLENNFTASMPLAEIYIDDTIVNQTLWKKDEYNGTRVIAELLVDNTQGKYAGFQINTDTSAVSADKGTLQNSYGGVWYDFTKRYLNDTQNLVVSGSNANNYELFSGDIVKYTLKGMATKFDVASNAYKNYDVVITYSDILITLCQNSGTRPVNQANISSILKLIDTNMVNFTWSGGFRAGLSYSVNVKVVDPDTGALIDGSYYYPMTDIDIGRTGIGGFANLYNASNLNRYSEQIALMSNYGRPTSSGSWEQMVWIPGGNYSAAPFTNKANVTEDNYPYTCNITSKTIDGQAKTLLISPGGTTTAVSGKITSASGVDKDNSFYSGFITLADNTAGGINIKGYASAPTSGGVESYVLTGSQIVNHKVDASSDVGGTIFTTTTGNSDGSLSGGTLLGYNEVNKPFEISAATGQSVTYTMTPKGGYKLKRVWVKDGDIDIMTIVNTAKATVNENDYDTNSDGELDENERQAYEAAVETAINTALASDSDTSAISVSSLTSLGKGVYTYTFAGIQEDKSIHIDWEKTDLTVTKELDPAKSGISDKFKFQIKLSDTSTEETTWRVRAKKNTGKLSYHNPYFTELVNTTYYFGYHEGHEEALPYSYIEVTETEDKNPYEEGWYIYYNGSYTPSYDTTADENTTYYQRDDTQSSVVTNYYYHLLGWNESTNSWEEKVIPTTSGVTDGAVLGLENLNTELPDYHRYNYDGTVVNNENYYNEETDTYDKYLMWIPDDTTGKQMLVVGNEEEYPDGTAFAMGDYYTYVYQEGIENYSGKVLKGEPVYVDINDVRYNPNFGGTGYWYTQDDTMPIYYNLINNSNGYTLNSSYTPLEGESGMYIITLPAGQTPNTDDLVNDGWDITVSRVGAIEDNFDLGAAMIAAGAKSVSGAVNTFEFELGVDETIDFNGVIPMGYNYEITEILDPNGKWLKVGNSSNAVVTDFDGEEHVTFTNTEKTFDVSIEKQTIDNVAGTFDFTIEIYKENVTPGQVQAITIQAYKNSEDTDVTYKLTNAGNPIDIEMNGISTTILTGDSYLSDGGSIGAFIGDLINTTSSSIVLNGLSGEITTEAATSIYDEVQEVVNEGNNSFFLEPVSFELRTPDIIDKIPYNPTTVPTGFNGSNGVFTTTLSNGDIKTFTNIPFGYKYEIKETLPAGWETVSKTNEIGTLTTADIVSTWVNKQKTYSLTITKETVNDEGGTFNFEVKVWKNTNYLDLSSLFSAKTDSNNDGIADDGIYKFTLMNGESNTIPNIPYGYSYEVYEVDSNGNRVVVGSNVGSTNWKLMSIAGNNTGTITDDTDVTFTNEPLRDITVYKKWVDGGKNHTSAEVQGTLELFQNTQNVTSTYTSNTTVTDQGNGLFEYKVTDLPKYAANGQAYTYEVKEVNIPSGYQVSYESGNAAADGETITNTELFDIEVGKTITGLKGDKNKEFEFTVKVWKEQQDNTQYEYVNFIDVDGGDGDQNPDWNLISNVAFTYREKIFEEDKEYTMYRVYGGGSWYGFNNEYRGTADSGRPDLSYENRIEGPYDDVLISFFEALLATPFVEMDYIPPYDTGEKVIIQGEEYPVFAAGYNSPGSEHAYSVYYGKPVIQKTYVDLSSQGGIDNGDGSYTFKLKDGESFTIPDIPYGYKYEIAEKDYSSEMYTTTVDGIERREISGTVTSNKTHNYVNDKDYTDLTITKNVTGNMGNKEKEFNFTVKVEGWQTVLKDKITSAGHYTSYGDGLTILLSQDHTQDVEDIADFIEDSNQENFRVLVNGEIAIVAGADDFAFYDYQNGVIRGHVSRIGPTYLNFSSGSSGEHIEIHPNDVVELQYYRPLDLPSYFNKIGIEHNVVEDEDKYEFDEVNGLDIIHYTVSFDGGQISFTDTNWDMISDDGIYTFTLKDGESLTLPNIPADYSYEIIEDDYSSEGYHTYTDDGFTENREVSGTLDSNKSHTYINRNDAVLPTRVTVVIGGGILLLLPLLLLGYIIVRKRSRQR